MAEGRKGQRRRERRRGETTDLVEEVRAVEGVDDLEEDLGIHVELRNAVAKRRGQLVAQRDETKAKGRAHMSSCTLGVAEAVRAMMGILGKSTRK